MLVMENVANHTSSLINAIKEGNEYKNYHSLLESLKNDAELYRKVNEIRRRSLSLQFAKDIDLIEENAKLYEEYEHILNNPLVNEFLSVEQSFCEMIKLIEDKITESVNIDISFMED